MRGGWAGRSDGVGRLTGTATEVTIRITKEKPSTHTKKQVSARNCWDRKIRLREVRSRTEIKLKSLILAQIERWRNALHMQVERQRGGG